MHAGLAEYGRRQGKNNLYEILTVKQILERQKYFNILIIFMFMYIHVYIISHIHLCIENQIYIEAKGELWIKFLCTIV